MRQFYLNTYPIISVVIFYIMYLVMIIFQVILLSEHFEHVNIYYPGWKIVWVVTLLILPWMLSLIVKHRCISKLEKTDDNAEFMFAGNWTSLTIYLACNNVVFEEDNTVDESVPWHPVEGNMSEYAGIMNAIIEKITT